ncbi:ABC transporter ATP-binding protein [Myxococcus sp. AM009]|uniref:ABC transporter ATP-binding protein n=1 Tax=unclassified Myxococcus TaxID=2648731 RepID=UPI0015959FA2|nr:MULTISPECIES: ABC transporter ATP-binding protein [unclassified Myxococcus]NVJ01415.1 ABC transporter ATP-binding protein [Myxococcus sp. AM009]NVJ18072.1 ABC transporter ATP-binding protein [Myxococcus sp. AM010]
MSGIHVQELGKRFGDRVAVEALSFHVRPGEVFGLLGPNGAGKTTTVRMLTGLLRPTEGEATVWGHRVDRDGEPLRKVVGLLTEQPGLYDRLTARENLRFFMKLHELDEAAAWPRARHYLERFGLGGREQEPVGGFSKGMRQKLAIVRTLVHDPKVIFLDEPTSGLDPESARTVRDAVAELASEGRTIVLCSHNLAEVERLCERVAVVKRRLLAMGPVRELRHAGQALEVRVEGEAERFRGALARLAFAPNVLAEGPKLRVMLADDAQAPDVVACLVGAGARVHSAVPTQRPLEEVYLELLREGRG